MPQPVTASFPFKSILRIRLTISPKHKHTHEHNNYTNTDIHNLPVGVSVSVVSLVYFEDPKKTNQSSILSWKASPHTFTFKQTNTGHPTLMLHLI